ncbi:MAG: leucine-rich repeat domain-containing protein [Clostridia bacterium]|nr:leucine-rich repeat domain-containing protein [Clostridia bacterium]
MNTFETKNIVKRKKRKQKIIIASIAVFLAAVIIAVFALSLGSKGFTPDLNRAASRGLSFDKTSIVSKTYTLVGIGACKDKDLVVQAEKDGMPVAAVGEMAFRGNETIRSIILPEGVSVIGSSAFAYCNSLEAVVFKGKVTHIGNSSFRYCASLREITLPASVITIADSAFSHCTSLTKIHFGGTMEEWKKIRFGAHWNVNMPEYTVYCTDGEIFVDAYSKYREVA